MTSAKRPETPPSDDASAPADTAGQEHAARVEPFKFPFSPEVFAPAKGNDKPWHQKGNKSNHDQRPGPAPRGTRRSMGKR